MFSPSKTRKDKKWSLEDTAKVLLGRSPSLQDKELAKKHLFRTLAVTEDSQSCTAAQLLAKVAHAYPDIIEDPQEFLLPLFEKLNPTELHVFTKALLYILVNKHEQLTTDPKKIHNSKESTPPFFLGFNQSSLTLRHDPLFKVCQRHPLSWSFLLEHMITLTASPVLSSPNLYSSQKFQNALFPFWLQIILENPQTNRSLQLLHFLSSPQFQNHSLFPQFVKHSNMLLANMLIMLTHLASVSPIDSRVELARSSLSPCYNSENPYSAFCLYSKIALILERDAKNLPVTFLLQDIFQHSEPLPHFVFLVASFLLTGELKTPKGVMTYSDIPTLSLCLNYIESRTSNEIKEIPSILLTVLIYPLVKVIAQNRDLQSSFEIYFQEPPKATLSAKASEILISVQDELRERGPTTIPFSADKRFSKISKEISSVFLTISGISASLLSSFLSFSNINFNEEGIELDTFSTVNPRINYFIISSLLLLPSSISLLPNLSFIFSRFMEDSSIVPFVMYRLYIITNLNRGYFHQKDLCFFIHVFNELIPSLCRNNRPITVRVLNWIVTLCRFTTEGFSEEGLELMGDKQKKFAFYEDSPSSARLSLMKPIFLSCLFEIWKYQPRLAWHRLRFILNEYSLVIKEYKPKDQRSLKPRVNFEELIFVTISIICYISTHHSVSLGEETLPLLSNYVSYFKAKSGQAGNDFEVMAYCLKSLSILTKDSILELRTAWKVFIEPLAIFISSALNNSSETIGGGAAISSISKKLELLFNPFQELCNWIILVASQKQEDETSIELKYSILNNYMIFLMKKIDIMKMAPKSQRVKYISCSLTTISQLSQISDITMCLSQWLGLRDSQKQKSPEKISKEHFVEEEDIKSTELESQDLESDINYSVSPMIMVKHFVDELTSFEVDEKLLLDIIQGYSFVLSRVMENEIKFLGRAIFKGWESNKNSREDNEFIPKNKIIPKVQQGLNKLRQHDGSLHMLRHQVAIALLYCGSHLPNQSESITPRNLNHQHFQDSLMSYIDIYIHDITILLITMSSLQSEVNTSTVQLLNASSQIMRGGIFGWQAFFERWLISIVRSGKIGMNMEISRKKDGKSAESEWVYAHPPSNHRRHNANGQTEGTEKSKKVDQAQLFLDSLMDLLYKLFDTVLREGVPSHLVNIIFCISGFILTLHRLGNSMAVVYLRRWLTTLLEGVARPILNAQERRHTDREFKSSFVDYHRNDEIQFAISISLGFLVECLIEPVLDDTRAKLILSWIDGHYEIEMSKSNSHSLEIPNLSWFKFGLSYAKVQSIKALLPLYLGAPTTYNELQQEGIRRLTESVSNLSKEGKNSLSFIGSLFGMITLNNTEMTIGRIQLVREKLNGALQHSYSILEKFVTHNKPLNQEDLEIISIHSYILGWCSSATFRKKGHQNEESSIDESAIIILLHNLERRVSNSEIHTHVSFSLSRLLANWLRRFSSLTQFSNASEQTDRVSKIYQNYLNGLTDIIRQKQSSTHSQKGNVTAKIDALTCLAVISGTDFFTAPLASNSRSISSVQFTLLSSVLENTYDLCLSNGLIAADDASKKKAQLNLLPFSLSLANFLLGICVCMHQNFEYGNPEAQKENNLQLSKGQLTLTLPEILWSKGMGASTFEPVNYDRLPSHSSFLRVVYSFLVDIGSKEYLSTSDSQAVIMLLYSLENTKESLPPVNWFYCLFPLFQHPSLTSNMSAIVLYICRFASRHASNNSPSLINFLVLMLKEFRHIVVSGTNQNNAHLDVNEELALFLLGESVLGKVMNFAGFSVETANPDSSNETSQQPNLISSSRVLSLLEYLLTELFLGDLVDNCQLKSIRLMLLRTIGNHLDLKKRTSLIESVHSLVLQIYEGLNEPENELDFALLQVATGCGIFLGHDDWLKSIHNPECKSEDYVKYILSICSMLEWEWMDSSNWIHEVLTSWCHRVQMEYYFQTKGKQLGKRDNGNLDHLSKEQHQKVMKAVLHYFKAVTVNDKSDTTGGELKHSREAEEKLKIVTQCLDILILMTSVKATEEQRLKDSFVLHMGFQHLISGFMEMWCGGNNCITLKSENSDKLFTSDWQPLWPFLRLTHLLPFVLRENKDSLYVNQIVNRFISIMEKVPLHTALSRCLRITLFSLADLECVHERWTDITKVEKFFIDHI